MMGEISFAKLDKMDAALPIGAIYKKPKSSQMFRVIGPNNEVECFTGSRQERTQTMKLWKSQRIGDSRFAALVTWPTFN